MSFRVSTAEDVPAIVGVLTSAFLDDPVWGPPFADRSARPRQAAALWRLLVSSGQRYGWVQVTSGLEATALWIPPGGVELTPDEEEGLEQYLLDACGPSVTAELLETFAVFATARPADPHFYLSLLGTHADHRGRGLGMALLRHGLALIDEQGMPAYLESTNPANLDRYRGVGFERLGEFGVPGGRVVTTMWRPAARRDELRHSVRFDR